MAVDPPDGQDHGTRREEAQCVVPILVELEALGIGKEEHDALHQRGGQEHGHAAAQRDRLPAPFAVQWRLSAGPAQPVAEWPPRFSILPRGSPRRPAWKDGTMPQDDLRNWVGTAGCDLLHTAQLLELCLDGLQELGQAAESAVDHSESVFPEDFLPFDPRGRENVTNVFVMLCRAWNQAHQSFVANRLILSVAAGQNVEVPFARGPRHFSSGHEAALSLVGNVLAGIRSKVLVAKLGVEERILPAMDDTAGPVICEAELAHLEESPFSEEECATMHHVYVYDVFEPVRLQVERERAALEAAAWRRQRTNRRAIRSPRA